MSVEVRSVPGVVTALMGAIVGCLLAVCSRLADIAEAINNLAGVVIR